MTSVSQAPATKLLAKQNIVEVITYTASLSSDPTTVDSLLDTLRTITSNTTTSFSLQEITALHELQQKLEDYLVHQEKLRSFTYDSLHFHITEHFTGTSRLKTLNWVTGGIILIATMLGVLAVLLNIKDSPDRSAYMGLSVLYAILYLGMAGLFKEAARELTPEARKAYTYIFVAMSATGIIMLLQPAVALTPLQFHPIAPTIITLPQIITFTILYIGVRKIAQLFNVQSRVLSTPFMLLGALVVVAIAFLAPLLIGLVSVHYLPYPYFVSAMMLQGFHSFLLGMSALVLGRTYRKVNDFYALGIKALMLGVAMHTLVSTYFVVFYWPFIGKLYPNIFLAIGMLGMFFVALIYLRAAYIFNKVHHS